MPGLKRWGFLTPPVPTTAALLRAALLASDLRGALVPVFLRAVCLVRAIVFDVFVNFLLNLKLYFNNTSSPIIR